MVQMKEMSIKSLMLLLELYIPHGSDESNIAGKKPPTPRVLYIPHGSDERG